MQPHLAGIFNRRLSSILLFLPSPRRRLRQPYVSQRLHGGDRNQLIKRFLAEYLIHTFAVSSHGRRDQHRIRRRMQFKMLFRMRQRVVRD